MNIDVDERGIDERSDVDLQLNRGFVVGFGEGELEIALILLFYVGDVFWECFKRVFSAMLGCFRRRLLRTLADVLVENSSRRAPRARIRME